MIFKVARKDIIWVFAYDIVDNRARRRVAALLEDYAVRVQGSVFEGRMHKKTMLSLADKIEMFLIQGDKLRIYPLPDSLIKKCHSYGGAPLPEKDEFWLF